jgi:predicted outer membrane protein
MRARVLALALVLVACVASAEDRPDAKKLLAIETTLLGRNDTYDRRVEAAKIASALAEERWTKERAERLEFAKKVIEHCRAAIQKDAKRVEAHFHLAVGIGRKLDNERIRGPGALSEVKEMEREALAAVQADASYESAGPHRFLGILYAEAPEIGSIGDWDKSVEHFEAALKIAPSWPENYLEFAKQLAKRGEFPRARTMALKAVGLCRPDPKRPADPADLEQWDREARELLQKIKDKK